MAEYRAKEGQEDRHGEMTGAITVNMVLSMPPVTAWCVFIGPWLFERLAPTLIIGLVLAVALPIACFKPSRAIWARMSDWADRV